MTISWFQAALLGLFACLSSMPGLGGTSIGNYTLGRPLVGGLVSGLILGDVKLGIICGVAMQLVYIALVTPGGTVSADVRAVSYIGIPLAMVAIQSQGLSLDSADAANLAKSMGTLVGTVGTVLFYGTATMNLLWQHIGWKAVEKGEFKRLYVVDWGLPWISHLVFSFLPTLIMCKLGADAVGMSTVPEVIVARHSDIKVFGISVITDLGGFDVPVKVSHEEVQEAANAAQPRMTEIMREMIKRS